MGTTVLAVFLALLGAVYITPGALPVAASKLIFVSRLAAGFAFLVSAVGLVFRLPEVIEIGLAMLGGAHAVAAWVIFRQPCAPPKQSDE
jgi:hypothetical protein